MGWISTALSCLVYTLRELSGDRKNVVSFPKEWLVIEPSPQEDYFSKTENIN